MAFARTSDGYCERIGMAAGDKGLVELCAACELARNYLVHAPRTPRRNNPIPLK